MKIKLFLITTLLTLTACSDSGQSTVSAKKTSPSKPFADFTNSIGMPFKALPKGSFYMGSCKLTRENKEADKKRAFLGEAPLGATCPSGAALDNDAYDGETPQHKVTVPAFFMAATEVTVGQFKQFIREANRSDLLTEDFTNDNQYSDQAAVARVSWHDAQAFITWLNSKEGVDTYRLPSEAEWEYAARAGTTTRFSWGNNANVAGQYAWYEKNVYDRGIRHAMKVGVKQHNAFGLYDMHGNLWEWTQDCWNNSYHGAPRNGSAWRSGDCDSRLLRGGSWDYDAGYLRSAFRYTTAPSNRYIFSSFRVVQGF